MEIKENDFDAEVKELVDIYRKEFSDIIELTDDCSASERSNRIIYMCVVTDRVRCQR